MEHSRLSTWESAWRVASITLCLVFAVLAIEITKSPSLFVALDTWFENMIVTIRTPLLSHTFIWITHLGSIPFVAGIVAIAGILLVSSRKYWAYVVGFFVTLSGSVVSGYLLKELIARPRPGGIIPMLAETSGSFPSGHATIGIALYGFLAYLLYVLFPTQRPFIVVGATLLIALIGFSRLYLGVHFPTDVIAGYALGGIWLIIGVETVRKVSNKIPPSL
ncbi:MAG: phosphatase PAP2 family protein [bacterium]|nr:phosphatase PAP2 family protein [bacterium]